MKTTFCPIKHESAQQPASIHVTETQQEANSYTRQIKLRSGFQFKFSGV